ncbi:putative 2OG-Fe(II) oxygenase [Sandaracinobacteroides saxicola]|uniref:Tetratricopeptide repeat protein n=1 Tax=Sandaracinobacteroides saxicola TaxID=2759707 RepID=A0A7G5IJR7_9SPHN|nr:putative 2OG-Fe(II) oxygenase [Sandaracinobacteroides saxicola]QMW23609.1 tetratricopeptide repeat protein [Sandaracinobacteroides saxicola]
MTAPMLLNQALQKFNAGAFDAARADLLSLLRTAPNTGPAQHLLALVERRRGDPAAARAAFVAANRLIPGDHQLANNWGNFLAAEGDPAGAILAYRRATSLKKDFADPWRNMAITAQDMGNLDLAGEALAQAHRLAPNDHRVWTSLGLLLRERGEHDKAADILDTALKLKPDHPLAASARAQVEAERGRPSLALYARARALNPADRALLLAETQARVAEGDPARLDPLAAAVAADPTWAEGQLALAKLRWEAGEGAHSLRGLDAALAAHPADGPLWEARLRLAQAAGEPVPPLADRARAAVGPLPAITLIEAEAQLAAGNTPAAETLLLTLPDDADRSAALARVRLRQGDGAAAAALLEPLLATTPHNRLLWALLATAWRLAGNPHADWLLGGANLWGRFDLGLSPADLATIADHLRGLHSQQRAPLDQSLRGGTQTVGTLFLRTAPEIVRLRRAAEAAVDAYLAQLPPPVEGHPLLAQPRAGWRFTGSWSVRLAGQGFHVPHVHPEGWISSAIYLSLPETMGGQAQSGWLTLGEPPSELALPLPPLATLEPVEGTVALFPSFLWHGTRPFAAGERLTAAFDVTHG